MKCHPLRWAWGMLPLAALSFVAAQYEHGGIESDLKIRVDRELKSAGFKWASTSFSGRDGVLKGEATDEADPGRAYDIARSIGGVRVVDNQATVIEKLADYRWSVTRTGSGVRLGGFVPNDSVRAEILKMAKAHFPGQTVADEMKLARGVPSPEAWLPGVNFGMKQVAGLKSGEAQLNGLALTVAGDAADTSGFNAVKKALATDLPKGLKLADDRITAPLIKPYVWAAKHEGGQLVLSGFVPGKRRDEMLGLAKTAFPRATIIDRMQLGEGAPSAHMGAAASVLRELARLENGTVEIRDETVSLQGLAADATFAETARKELARGLPKGYQLSEAITIRDTGPKPVSPYTTAVQADAGAVVLTGYAPSEVAREQLLQSARTRFPGRRIDNQLQIAPGAPAGWARCLDGALKGAGRLGGGKIALSDRRLEVSGSTDDEALAGAVPNEIKAEVRADCDANVRVDVLAEAALDLVWRASYDGAEVVLEGDVSSAATKSSLAATAQRAFPGKNIVDRMRIVETRTRAWPAVAEQGLMALAELQKGEARLVRQQLTVSGQASSPAIVTRVHDQVTQGLAKGYAGRDEITVAVAVAAPPPQPRLDTAQTQCQATLQNTSKEGIIRFERASATLAPESFATLDKLVTAVKNCPNIFVEIEGHTDAEGTPERNKALSDRRAQSVVDYLARGGIDAKQLTALGYGDTRPLVPNDTPDNRAKNRRIEFIAKPR